MYRSKQTGSHCQPIHLWSFGKEWRLHMEVCMDAEQELWHRLSIIQNFRMPRAIFSRSCQHHNSCDKAREWHWLNHSDWGSIAKNKTWSLVLKKENHLGLFHLAPFMWLHLTQSSVNVLNNFTRFLFVFCCKCSKPLYKKVNVDERKRSCLEGDVSQICCNRSLNHADFICKPLFKRTQDAICNFLTLTSLNQLSANTVKPL